MAQPVIGLTLDSEPPGGYSALPWYAVRQNYCAAVVRAGGIPVLLPHEVEQADAYLRIVDGLIVTGGGFDVDPAIFGAVTRHPSVKTKERRTQFELAVARQGLAADKPVLGICGGQQLLNVALGGSLIQHIPDEVPGALDHKQKSGNEPGHLVRFAEGTRLREIAGCGETAVNSTHHQAVKAPGAGLLVDATAPDGIVEGIEDPRRRFCIGVQWHPEYAISEADLRLFAAFIEAARA